MMLFINRVFLINCMLYEFNKKKDQQRLLLEKSTSIALKIKIWFSEFCDGNFHLNISKSDQVEQSPLSANC